MLIYLGAFAVSVGIAAYGEHLRTKKNNEKGFYLCLALAVLVVLLGLWFIRGPRKREEEDYTFVPPQGDSESTDPGFDQENGESGKEMPR